MFGKAVEYGPSTWPLPPTWEIGLNLFIWKIEWPWERERKGYISSWFPQIPATAGLSWVRHKTRVWISTRFSMWLTGTQCLSRYLLPSCVCVRRKLNWSKGGTWFQGLKYKAHVWKDQVSTSTKLTECQVLWKQITRLIAINQ